MAALPQIQRNTACPVEQAVLRWMACYPRSAHVVIAYSGGMDSTVLLHVFARACITNLTAIHIHHGLQSAADAFEQRCTHQAQLWSVPFRAIRIQIASKTRQGVEANARAGRYQALWQQVMPQGYLLTAHHQRDQAETFLLQAARGAGVNGLSAMRPVMPHTEDRLLIRPLLSVGYEDILHYAHQHHLTWIDDPSNHEDRFTRNRIRHHVLSALNPHGETAATQSIARACDILAETQTLLHEFAQEDWHKIAINDHAMDLHAWRELSWLRAKNVLSWYWQHTTHSVFEAKHWALIQAHYYHCQPHARQMLKWKGFALLLDQQLWIIPEAWLGSEHRINEVIIPTHQAVTLAWTVCADVHYMPNQAVLLPDYVKIRIRQEGDQLVDPQQGHHAIKKWLQNQKLANQKIPAWQKSQWAVMTTLDGEVIDWANRTSSSPMTMQWRV